MIGPLGDEFDFTWNTINIFKNDNNICSLSKRGFCKTRLQVQVHVKVQVESANLNYSDYNHDKEVLWTLKYWTQILKCTLTVDL